MYIEYRCAQACQSAYFMYANFLLIAQLKVLLECVLHVLIRNICTRSCRFGLRTILLACLLHIYLKVSFVDFFVIHSHLRSIEFSGHDHNYPGKHLEQVVILQSLMLDIVMVADLGKIYSQGSVIKFHSTKVSSTHIKWDNDRETHSLSVQLKVKTEKNRMESAILTPYQLCSKYELRV